MVSVGTSGPLLFDLGSLADRLQTLSDARHRRGKRYSLAVVLLLLILAKLAGEDRLSGIGDWVQGRRTQLCAALHLARPTLPHANTFRRILSEVVSPSELESLVQEFFQSLPAAGQSVLVAIDGKTVRGTITASQPRGEHLLCAYLPAEGLVLLQVAAGAKENEISVAPALLAGLDLRGKVVVGDALHTQRALSAQILAAGGDYLWLAKDNQPTLHQEIADLFTLPTTTAPGGQIPTDFRTARAVDKGHGRQETRQITVSSALHGYSDWPGLAQVFQLERERVNRQTGQLSREVVHGLTSLHAAKASPPRLLAFVRHYWGIESGLHYRRDVTFREDATRLTVGQAGRVMATVNNLVIGLLRWVGHTNLAHARRTLASNLRAALKLLTTSPRRL
jgi:predicted transposase YbfD/YdcC